MMQGQPIIIVREGTSRDRGKGAQFNNIAAARAVADAVRSTLGPRGMDKMLVDSLGDVTITNDGVTILKEIEIEHPAAKMIVEVAKTQDQEAGDGTTTAVILAGELLKGAESLLEANVHPTTIAHGYKLAAERAIALLRDISFAVKPDDKVILAQIASTAMGGRAIGNVKEYLADITVRAVLAVTDEVAGERRADVDNVLVQKKHGHT
ncbi:MAG: TCP-1/cpn60 chaperonin family protein, partial [Candidatus Thermoplasmatota archaeon]